MPDSPVSATDPLRAALEQIAALQARWQAPTSSEDTADSNAKWAAVGSEAHGIAVEALAAVPAEPEVHYSGMTAQQLYDELNDVGAGCSRLECDQLEIHDALVAIGLEGAINARSIIERIESLRPAEPEAWEWRAVEQDDCFPCGPFTDKARAQEWARRIDGYVERRRAPGPWERVDPEPLTFPPLDEGPLAHLLDGPVKPDPPVDPEPQRATGPWERVDLRARLCPISGDDCPREGPTHSDGSPFGPCDECDGRPQDGGER